MIARETHRTDRQSEPHRRLVRRPRLFQLLSIGLLCGLPAVAGAQEVPSIVTVPWVANVPQVPHDIVSGRMTRLKGVQRGFEPQGEQENPFQQITSVTIEALVTCGNDALNFSLNGVDVGTLAVNDAHCTCTPPLTRADNINRQEVLDAWQPDVSLDENIARMVKATSRTHELWVAMTIHNGAQSRRICIHDRSEGGCVSCLLYTSPSPRD